VRLVRRSSADVEYLAALQSMGVKLAANGKTTGSLEPERESDATRTGLARRASGDGKAGLAAMANQPADCCDFRIYNAYHEGDLVASTIWVRVGGHSWYSYGASSTAKRDVRGSNAIQWRMMSDALAAGASVYDLRGITDTLDPNDPHVGLIQFKVGTGGEAVEYVGEWDLPLNKALYTAFDLYMRRR
jgi:lipid II:glycine glycyltransferase (peptidoglycan interpeptide bridge formation enzyme)